MTLIAAFSDAVIQLQGLWRDFRRGGEDLPIYIYRSKAPSRMSVNAETAVSMQWEARTSHQGTSARKTFMAFHMLSMSIRTLYLCVDGRLRQVLAAMGKTLRRRTQLAGRHGLMRQEEPGVECG